MYIVRRKSPKCKHLFGSFHSLKWPLINQKQTISEREDQQSIYRTLLRS